MILGSAAKKLSVLLSELHSFSAIALCLGKVPGAVGLTSVELGHNFTNYFIENKTKT